MIIHLTGSDTYRSAQRLAELRQAFIAKHDKSGLSTVTLDGATATVEELRTALTATGFFGTKRFVALDRYLGDGLITPEALTELLTVVASKSHPVVAVIRDLMPDQAAGPVRRTKTAAKKKSTTKKVTAGMLIWPDEKRETFPLMTESEASAWVVATAKTDGGVIVPAAAQRLVMLCERDSWRIASELAKLVAFAGGRPIIIDDVVAMVQSEYAGDIFALTDAIGQRQTARALDLLHGELAAGTNEFALIATLAGHVRNLYAVKRSQEDGTSPAAMAGALDLHPFVVQKALAQAPRFQADELRDLHHRLLEIDDRLKTSRLDAETMLDLLVTRR